MSKILTAVVLGTGETISATSKLGVGHEFLMSLIGAKIDGVPDIEDHENPCLPTIEECEGQFTGVRGAPINVILDADNKYVVPAPTTHFGVNFTEKDLLVIYGISSDAWTNAFNPEKIQQEVLAKANAMADSYFDQILANKGEDEIKLFVYGFSRGGCIAMQAMNMLYKKLSDYDALHKSNILDKVIVDMFLLDPVPGNEAIEQDPLTRTIPAFVKKMQVIYSEYEFRAGFHPLREFYKQEDDTEVDIRTFPCDHATIKRRDADSEDTQNAPAEIVTHLLAEQYAEFTKCPIHMPVYVIGDLLTCTAAKRIYPIISDLVFGYNETELQMYRKLAHIKQKKFFGFLSPLFYHDRKIRVKEKLENVYANWPTALKRFEDECHAKAEKIKFLPLINQLQALLRHGYKSNSLKNAELIYNNFEACIADLTAMLKHDENSTEFKSGYFQLKATLESISQQVVHDNLLMKIVMVGLAILATVCTLGIAGILFYQNKSHNYFTLQPKTGYLADCTNSELEKLVPGSESTCPIIDLYTDPKFTSPIFA